jgi:hypothetical protein
MSIACLKKVGLLRIMMLCNNCGREMTWCPVSSVNEGVLWRWHKRVSGITCNQSASIRQGSWFQDSKLTIQEIPLITYDIVYCEPAHKIRSEYRFSDHSTADWGMFVRETMLLSTEGSSVKIVCPNKTVEIDDSNFGRRKFQKGHPLKGQWGLAVWNENPAKHFLLRSRTDPSTRWWSLYVTGSNSALRSLVIVGSVPRSPFSGLRTSNC